jgi:hypothetical protein
MKRPSFAPPRLISTRILKHEAKGPKLQEIWAKWQRKVPEVGSGHHGYRVIKRCDDVGSCDTGTTQNTAD